MTKEPSEVPMGDAPVVACRMHIFQERSSSLHESVLPLLWSQGPGERGFALVGKRACGVWVSLGAPEATLSRTNQVLMSMRPQGVFREGEM